VIVIEVECVFNVDGVARHCGPGSLLRVPANAEHYVEVIGDRPVFEMTS